MRDQVHFCNYIKYINFKIEIPLELFSRILYKL